MVRLRAQYSLGSDLRFLSNLDLMHMVERALRRADIPFFLSQGYNPHIRLSMGTVLPVGLWGQEEYFDLELEEMQPELFKQRMNEVLPPAMHIQHCRLIPQESPSLMKVINAAAYAFCIRGVNQDQLNTLVRNWYDSSALPVPSRGKKKDQVKDLRTGIFRIDMGDCGEALQLEFLVSAGEPLNIRYDELLDLISSSLSPQLIVDYFRKGNYIKKKDRIYSPLEKVM